MKLPWVSRKRFEAENAEFKHQMIQEQARYRELGNANNKERGDLGVLLRNFYALYAAWEPKSHDLQIVYTVDSLMLRGIPAHDSRMFEMVARRLAGEVERELRMLHMSSLRELESNFSNERYSVRHMADEISKLDPRAYPHSEEIA